MLDAIKFSLMNSGLKLALNTTLVLRVQWLIKWASHLTSKVRKPPDHRYMFYYIHKVQKNGTHKAALREKLNTIFLAEITITSVLLFAISINESKLNLSPRDFLFSEFIHFLKADLALNCLRFLYQNKYNSSPTNQSPSE